MGKLRLVFSLLLLPGGLWTASAVALAQVSPPVEASTGALLELSPRAVDLGRIPLRSKHRIRVVARNTSLQPQVITAVRASCDCTKPTWRRAPILPGDSTVVELQFAPSERGAFYKVVRLETASPAPRTPEIVLRGTAY